MGDSLGEAKALPLRVYRYDDDEQGDFVSEIDVGSLATTFECYLLAIYHLHI